MRGKPVIQIVVALAGLLAAPSSVRAADAVAPPPPPYAPYRVEVPRGPDAGETSGLAILGGLGYQTPVLGVQVDYLLVVRPAMTIIPYAGGGYWPATKTGFGIKTEPTWTAAAGAMAVWGTRHRGYVDVGYGAGAIQGVGDTQDTLYGVTLGGGYEYLGPRGFILRVGGGATRLFGDLYNPNEDRIRPTLNFALGTKL